MTSLSSSKTEFACVFYDVFGVGGFTGLIQGRVLTIFLWEFSHLLLIDISLNIVLALVISFPTNLVSLNSELVCERCGYFDIACFTQRGCTAPWRGAPLDRYNRCLERLYRSRIGPKVVPAMYRSTTGLVSVLERFLGGC